MSPSADPRYKGHHWSVTQIAKFAGVSRNCVYRWMRGYDNTMAPFPRPIIVTRGLRLWDSKRVRAWLKDGRKLIYRPEAIDDN